jgi:hypothetical protein
LFNLFAESLLDIRSYELRHLRRKLLLAEFRSLASAVAVENRVKCARIVAEEVFLDNELHKNG